MPSLLQPVLSIAELSGTVLDGRYQLGQVLGAGGMGTVFEATDQRLARPVAIKVIRPVFAGHMEYIKRFLREAQTASKVRHRNVVVILDYGHAEGNLVYSVMELLAGQDLEQLLIARPDGRLPWARACQLLVQIASGLRAAHAQGVVHRDIKPANCFVTQEDDQPVVKLVDFGIAKLDDASQPPRLTGTTQLLGTPSYLAPELARTQGPANARSDIYSLGVVAYRMLTGRLPFLGQTAVDVMMNACVEPVPPLREQVPELPLSVEGLVRQMLAKRAEERPEDMGVVRERLLTLSRETLGSHALVSTGSSALRIEVGGEVSSEVERTAVLADVVQARGSNAVASGSATEFAVEKTEVLDSQPEFREAVPRHSFGAPRQVVEDSGSLQSGPAQTVPGLGESTLQLGAAETDEHRLGSRLAWLGVGGVAALAVFGGIGLSGIAGGDGDEQEPRRNVATKVGKVEPEALKAPLDFSSGSTGPEGDERVAATGPHAGEDTGEAPLVAEHGKSTGPEPLVVPAEPEPFVESPPAPPSKPQNRAPSGKKAHRPKPPPIPPPDAAMKKKLARKIKARCAEMLSGGRVKVSFFVTEDGDVSAPTATPKNAAGDCAKAQVRGTKFRARSKETLEEVVLE